MVRQHHRLKGREFEQTLGDSEGEGNQAWCPPWGTKELDMTKQLNNRKKTVVKVLKRGEQKKLTVE